MINPIETAPIFVSLTSHDPGQRRRVALIVLTLAILPAAPWIGARIGETGQRIVAKIMGLITAVIGVPFVLNGVEAVALAILRVPRG